MIRILLLFLLYSFSVVCFALPHKYERFNNLGGKTQNLCVRSIAQSKDGMIWLGTEEGLYSFDGCHLALRAVPKTADGKGMGCINCMAAVEDSLLLGCEHGMLSFRLNDYSLHVLSYAKDEDVRNVQWVNNHCWVATRNALYRDGKKQSTGIQEIFAFSYDKEGFYIGTRDALLHQSFSSKGNGEWEKVIERLLIVAIVLPTTEHVWVGTAGNVVALNRKTRSIDFMHEVPVAKALCEDGKGNLLVGTDNGLMVIDKSGKVQHVHHDASVSESLAGDAVWSIFRDRNDNIWLGTNSGVSMVPSCERVKNYALPSITGEKNGNQLFCILSDYQERIWMGGSNGLICIENIGKEDQTYKWYRMDNTQLPLRHNRIRAIYEDRQQRLWVGGDGGLLLLNETTGQMERYAIPEDGNNWVYDLAETHQGELLVTTFHHTYVATPQPATHTMLVKKKTPRSPSALGHSQQAIDSLLARYAIAGNYLSSYEDTARGILLLGGTDQFSIFNMDDAALQRSQGAGLFVTDIRMNDAENVAHEDILAQRAVFPPDCHILEIFFADFNYTSGCGANFSYRLGRKGKWVNLHNAEQSIMLANLEAGTYELYVKTTRNGELAEEEECLKPLITFTIEAPWYATTWAKILYLLLFAGLAYSICHIIRQRKRLKKEREEKSQLLAKAKEKERELLNENEYLAAQLRLKLIEKSGEEGELSADEKFLLDITRIIEENMDDSELNVNALSQKSGISTKQLYRRIKALTGMTTVAYIRDQRLKKAASLLSKGSFTVSEVMYMVGFSSASYFTRCFFDEYGTTPSEYRG